VLDFSALRAFQPLIATPCHGNSLFLNYVLSAIRFQEAYFFSVGKRLDFFFRHGDSLVTRARNDCVAYFLANPQFTHLFWIDSDIGYSPEAAFRLLLCDHDVAAGVYPLKREEWPADGVPHGTTQKRFEELYARYTVNTGRLGEDVVLVIDSEGFMKVREAPTGFMCIKRRVFDRLIAAYPQLRYIPDWPEGSIPQGGVHYRFFDVTVDPESGRYLRKIMGSAGCGKRSAAKCMSMPIQISRMRANASIPAISARRCVARCRSLSVRQRAKASASRD